MALLFHSVLALVVVIGTTQGKDDYYCSIYSHILIRVVLHARSSSTIIQKWELQLARGYICGLTGGHVVPNW